MSKPFILSRIIKHVSESKTNPDIGSDVYKNISKTIFPSSINLAVAKGALVAGIFIVIGTVVIMPEIKETENMQVATNDKTSSQTNENNTSIQNNVNNIYTNDTLPTENSENSNNSNQGNTDEYEVIIQDETPLGVPESFSDTKDSAYKDVTSESQEQTTSSAQNKPQDARSSTESSTEGLNPTYADEEGNVGNFSNKVSFLPKDIELTYNLGEVISVQHFLEDVSKETGNAFSSNQLSVPEYNDYIPTDSVGEYYISVTYDDKNTFYESEVKIEILDIEPPQIFIEAEDNTLEVDMGNYITHEQMLDLAGVTVKDNSNNVEFYDTGYENIDFNKSGEYPIYLNGVDPSGNKAEQRILIVRVKNN